MSLLEHLDELRKRLIKALVAFGVAFVVCWYQADAIYDFLAQPIYGILEPGSKLIFLGLTDPFMIYVKVAALAGLFISTPVIFYQVWAFVAPALYRSEKRMLVPFVLFGTVLFVAGGAFGYYVAFPFAAEFLLGMGKQFQPQITVEKYLSFMMTAVIGLGLMFELPTVILLLSRMGLVTPRFLLRHFRWAVVLIFTAAAIITPTPDMVNMCIFAVPAVGLYLLGVAVAAIFGRRSESARSPFGSAEATSE